MNRQSIDVPVMWTKRQTKAKTGFSDFTIDKLIKSGKIKYIRLGAGQRGKILINAESICAYMRGGEQA